MSARDTMRALVVRSGGPLADAAIADVPVPEPGPGQVRVAVESAGLNAVDVKQADGTMPAFHRPPVVGFDCVGSIDAVGSGVTRFEVGDRVLASTTIGGSFAEYVLADDDARIAHRPAELDRHTAATLASAGFTAVEMLRRAALPKDPNVLIVGATGGVGLVLVQLAKAAGARVLATGHQEDRPLLTDLGADDVIDYRATDVASAVARITEGSGVDAVIDCASDVAGLAALSDAVKPGGRIVSSMGGSPPPGFGVPVHTTLVRPEPGELDDLVAEAVARRLRLPIAAVFGLDDAPRMLATYSTGHTVGKYVVDVTA